MIKNSNEILNYLSMGISIPIWSDFHKYILYDLNYFKAESIILIEEKETVGHCLVFDVGGDILYFGYFKVINDHPERISSLLDELIKYAHKNRYKTIIGPINIPAIIFGWGFMEKGSDTSLYIGKPVNPPKYKEIFLASGFYIKFEEGTWEGPLVEIDPWKIKKYNFNDYEVFFPKTREELIELKKTFLEIHARNLPSASRITPNVADLFDNYADFILTFGGYFMFIFVRYKPTGKIIASGVCLPNPFSKDDIGNYDSIVGYSWVVDKDHRVKGIGMLMYGSMTINAREKNYRYCSGPVSMDNETTKKFAKRVDFDLKRRHIILEYKL
jgi:L-amino acid N-acyltransferase YncA